MREPGPRLIGNVAIEADLGGGRARRSPASRTTAGAPTSARAPSRSAGSSSGFGNNGADGLEGVRRDNLIGTYLHGPLLPKNAWLADHLIALALERRYGSRPELEPLDDALEDAAHASARPRPGAASAAAVLDLYDRSWLSARSARRRAEPPSPRAEPLSSGEPRPASAGPRAAITTSWAIRSPGATSKRLAGSVFSSSTRSSPR